MWVALLEGDEVVVDAGEQNARGRSNLGLDTGIFLTQEHSLIGCQAAIAGRTHALPGPCVSTTDVT